MAYYKAELKSSGVSDHSEQEAHQANLCLYGIYCRFL